MPTDFTPHSKQDLYLDSDTCAFLSRVFRRLNVQSKAIATAQLHWSTQYHLCRNFIIFSLYYCLGLITSDNLAMMMLQDYISKCNSSLTATYSNSIVVYEYF